MRNTSQLLIKRYALCLLFVLAEVWSFGQSFNLNGTASYLGGLCYELTPDAVGQVGSIFSNNTVNLNESFTIEGKMNFGTKDGTGADGIVFILSTNPDALGGGGGGIGFAGITPSIGVEFDTYQNATYNDPVNDHMAIMANGAVVHTPPLNLAGPVNLGNIETGQDYCFLIIWDANNQTLIAGLNGNLFSYTGNIVNNIFGGNPIVHYGFSSATGLAYNRHVVCVVPIAPDPMPDVTICYGETIQLQADINGTSWSWQPDPSISNPNISNPFVDPVTTTTYIVGITYLCSATRYDTVTVTVNPDLSGNASNTGPECEGENITLNSWGGDLYNWSGPLGFSSDQPNPMLSGVTPGNAGTYSVTITDNNGCTSVAMTNVIIYPNPVVNIVSPAQPFCETGDPVQLTATPAGGSWQGDVGADGVFDPVTAGVGVHVIGYSYVDGNNCSAYTEVELTVVPNTPASITPPGPFCEEETMISLTANPPGGTWGGIANASGQIFPNTLGPGMYTVSYSLTLSNACYDTEIEIEIAEITTLIIPDLPSFCDDDPDYQLTGFEPPGGIWSGAASPTGLLQPQVLGPGSYQVTYTYTPPVCPVVSGSASFSVFGSPAVQNIERNCNATATNYTVQFEITGGDPSSYIVDGTVTGDLNLGNPAAFFSDPIPSGESYTFLIYDDNHCDTVVVTGSYSCNCVTTAGSMNQSPVTACEGESITVSAASGYILDPNDAIIYVLHTGNPFEYIVIGDGTEFNFEPPIETGVTYFVDALIGNDIPGPGIDLSDPCLAITSGPTVMWQTNPTGNLTVPTDICAGDAAVLTFTMTGEGPFDISYMENNTSFNIESVQSPYSITVYPENNTSYTFLSVTDLAGHQCSADINATVDIAVGETVEMELDYTICQGDSIFLEGDYQNSPGIYYDTISGGLSCDTFIVTMLYVLNSETNYINSTTCHASDEGVFENTYTNANGCDSVVIETITLVAADTTYQYETTCDPAETGTTEMLFVGNDGCDSLVINTITLTTNDTTYISGTSCNSADLGVFTNTYTSQNGCDSTVITTIMFSDGDTTYVNGVTCDPLQTGISVVTLTSQNGCDSTVISTITLTSADTSYISGTTCHIQQSGVFTNTYAGQNSCDSVVISTIALINVDSTSISGTTCDVQQAGVFTNIYLGLNGCDSVVIHTIILTTADTSYITGTTCDAQLAGVFTNNYIAQNGCDSIVISTITLTTADTSYISGTTCDGQLIGIFTNIYSAQNGCDSIVISTVTLTTADTSYIQSTTCDAQLVGVFTNNYTAQNGCDSVVISTVTLTTADTSYIQSTTCDAQLVGVFTNNYTALNGCDSVVISTITLTTADTSYVTESTCDESQVGISTLTYSAQNGCDSVVIETILYEAIDTMYIQQASCMFEDTGTLINTYQTYNGCDSVIITHIGWDEDYTVRLNLLTCITTDTGTVMQQFENMEGCDSIIIIRTALLPEEECGLNSSDHEKVFTPNAFSPNGDGINDQFYFMADVGVIADIQWLRIYDRWGGLVMEKINGQPNDPGFGWDGTYGGEMVSPGVYVWQAHLLFRDGMEKTMYGDVMLMR